MNDTTKAVVESAAPSAQRLLPVTDTSEFAELLDSNRFGQIQRVAKLFSESDLVPEIFQGKPANCAVALQMAFRLRVDPMMLMQNMYIVYGRPGIEAKLAIALMNQRGPFEGPVQWRVEGALSSPPKDGDTRSWTAYATHRGTGERCEATVTWAMVKAEGWLDKKGSKWQTIPDLMGRYRSAMFLGRLYCPEVLLGLPAADELQDAGHVRFVGKGDADGGDIQMPTAKAAAEQATAETKTAAPAKQAPIDVDPETGETSAPATRETSAPKAETKAAEPETKGPAAGTEEKKADGFALGKKASEAQRRMIMDIAKRGGLSVAQLDEHLIEKFSMGIDELPMGMVSEATQLVRSLTPATVK